MHDVRLEDALRQALRDEAASLPFTVSADILERRSAERARHSRTTRRWLVAAAAVAVVAVGGGAALLLRGTDRLPGTSPSPSPATSETTPLPEPAALLVKYPTTTLVFEATAGPASGGAEGVASPDASPARLEAGRVAIDGPFVLASACRGPGEMTITFGDESNPDFLQSTRPCDGSAHANEYLSDIPTSGPDGFAVSVTTSSGTAWRVAVGAYPPVAEQPVFPPMTPTPGWNQLVDVPIVLMSPTSGTGANFEAPDEAIRVAVQVRCQGEGTVSFFAGPAPTPGLTPAASAAPGPSATPIERIDCGAAPTSHRFETPVTGGKRVFIRATADRFVWIKLMFETDAALAATYPSAPPVPQAVADTPYAESTTTLVAVGTVGGNRQTVVPLRQARHGVAAGDVAPFAVIDEATGSSSLILMSVPQGEVVATVATTDAPALILASWLDVAHRQVFYVVTPDQQVGALRYHRVGFDGSGDQVIAEVPTGTELYLFGGSSAGLAADGSAFVIHGCDAGGCRFTIFDTQTGAVREVEQAKSPTRPVCSILGIAGGYVVVSTQDACPSFETFLTEAVATIVALPLDGGEGRDLVSGSILGLAVDTPTGPRLVFTRFGAAGDFTVESIDVETAESSILLTGATDDPLLMPRDLSLPEGWVLLATQSLGDFPQAAFGPRGAPILIDLVSGTQYEMVNLPH